MPIVTEVGGYVAYGDIVDGVTMQETLDEVTAMSRKTIIESKDADSRPRIALRDEAGESVKVPGSDNEAKYFLPVGANIFVNDGDFVEAGDVVAKIPRETTKTKDITGGLPRVAELFEARKPKDHADHRRDRRHGPLRQGHQGQAQGRHRPRGRRSEGVPHPQGQAPRVREGDRVRAGEALMDGPANPHDILRVLGERALAKYLVDEIQEVYRLQGVRINDKHIEVIVRQMLRRVTVVDPGDTNFLVDERSRSTSSTRRTSA
jgi:DNA-directed RNA polymerase subunit beta'